MKKTLVICLSLAISLSLGACSGEQEPSNNDSPSQEQDTSNPENAGAENATSDLEYAAVSACDTEFSKLHYFAEENFDESFYAWCSQDMNNVEILRISYDDEAGLIEQSTLRVIGSVLVDEAIQFDISVPEGTPNLAIRYEAGGTVRTYVPSYNGASGGVYLTEADIAPAREEQAEPAGEATDESDGEDTGADDGFMCSLYVLNDDADGLLNREQTIESSSAWHIWAALKRANPSIPLQAGLNSYEIVDGIGYLNVKAEIYDMNVGGGVESLLLQAIANTYIESTDAEKVVVLVNGETYESGHLYLDEPIGYSERY